MNPLYRDIIYNVFQSDRLYKYVDDPEEGPVYIVEYDKKKFIFSREAKEIFFKDYGHEWVKIVDRDITIFNMMFDFDAKQVSMQFSITTGDTQTYSIGI